MKLLRKFNCVSRYVAGVLLCIFAVELVAGIFHGQLRFGATADAALVTIESAPNTTATSFNTAGAQTVFIDDQIGYKFFRANSGGATGVCRYRKTTNGGATWGSPVTFDNQSDCIAISVWYDQWTPGDVSGTYIHLATIDESADDIYYNRLDTSNDSLLSVSSVSVTPASTATYANGTNLVNITKATDGKVYVTADDATGSGSELRSCSTNCNLAVNWTVVGTPPQGNADSWTMLMPESSGNVLLINRSTGNLLRYSVWNGTIWSSFVNIDSGAVRSTTYDNAMSATINTDNGDVYLVYVADANDFVTADHDIRTAVYSSGSWTTKTAVLTNATSTPGIHSVAIGRDQNNGDLYVAYAARSTIGSIFTSNTYFVKSSDGMTSWGVRSGPVNSLPGDFYGIDMNIMSYERLYSSWLNNTASSTRALYGDTIADISPEVKVAARGSHATTTRADTTNFYTGGSFSIESIATRTVSNISVTEYGSVDADNDLANVKLFYEFDTSAPYNCLSESYGGSESQFGTTVDGGFSGANGVASFGSSQSITPTKSLCVYTVMDVLPTADDANTLRLRVTNAASDVIVSGVLAYPTTPVAISGTTTLADPNLTQTHYHWRLDNGNETGATSATLGQEDTALPVLQVSTPRRLRIGVSVEGSTSTLPVSFQLEYGTAAPTCSGVSEWTAVEPTSAWNMFDSSFISNGANTTNIATSTGGVRDENSSFFVANGGVRDTNATTSPITLSTTNFSEVEFSVVASTSAAEGETYCFRVSRSGTPLGTYSVYPQVTIAADVTVQATGTQATSTEVGTNDVYYGGIFRFVENSSGRALTNIVLTEEGTVNAQTNLRNIAVRYDLDSTAPYDCASESFSGSESQFGSTQTSFSAANGTASFGDSVGISTTSSLCAYVIYDVRPGAANGETVNIVINSAAADVSVSAGGSVGPSTKIDILGTTTLRGGVVSQTSYHWRNNNGNEITASSATNGVMNVPVVDFSRASPIRLRIGVANTGPTSSSPTSLRLEYGLKITTCGNVGVWTDVNSASDEWDMFDSVLLTEGTDTTNIATTSGGVSDSGTTFLTPNSGIHDTSSVVPTTTIPALHYFDTEFSLISTLTTAYDTTYCFRLIGNGNPLPVYTNYAEILTAPKRDFKIQRGELQVSGTSTVITAGINYVAPQSSSSAFIRITNAHNTGAGFNSGGATQNADDVTVYIENPGNILSNIRFARPPLASNSTRVYWEIVEFVGEPGTDNEITVRNVGAVNLTATALTASTSVVSGVTDNSDVVVFVTGSSNRQTTSSFFASQVTAAWSTSSSIAVFTRGNNGSTIADISYAVVEFTGQNWSVQRVEHSYSAAAGTIESESITPVNSLAKTFIHTQKRMIATPNVANYGHEVWLNGIGSVAFRLESGVATSGQVSVAWVIENTQSGVSAMKVQRSNGNTSGGTAPLTLAINLSPAISATNNTSIFGITRATTVGINHPRAHAGFTISGTTTYTIWRSNTGDSMSYRTEVVEWPISDIGLRQNYYRFYVHNNALLPTDPWPSGPPFIPENTPIGSADLPMGNGEQVRLRMSIKVSNANMSAGLRSFKLQYGLRSTPSCTAVTSWNDVGAPLSAAIWRGFSATGTVSGTALSGDPATGSDLVLSQSDVAGPLVFGNPANANPYNVPENDDVEYDWHLEQNGANPRSTYCFRAVINDGELLDGYLQYPQIRTAGFTPLSQNWRWYSDTVSETPTTTLAAINTAPIDIAIGQSLAMRVTVKEAENIAGENARFRLQYSTDNGFQNASDVLASSTCVGSSVWCYTSGVAADNATITTAILDDSDSCVLSTGSGCGRHVSSPLPLTGHTHGAGAATEYSFTVRNVAPRINTVYYFRLYDTTNDEQVVLASGKTYPSLVTEGAKLVLGVSGLPSGTTTAGIVTDATTTPTSISFGDLNIDQSYAAAHRISVSTNATEGYQVVMFARQQLLNSYGEAIPPLSASNTSPVAWATGCTLLAKGCAGYHTTDATLRGGSARFAPPDSYAGLSTSTAEIMYSSIPANDIHDILYRVRVSELQEAGDYDTEVVYIAIPTY